MVIYFGDNNWIRTNNSTQLGCDVTITSMLSQLFTTLAQPLTYCITLRCKCSQLRKFCHLIGDKTYSLHLTTNQNQNTPLFLQIAYPLPRYLEKCSASSDTGFIFVSICALATAKCIVEVEGFVFVLQHLQPYPLIYVIFVC